MAKQTDDRRDSRAPRGAALLRVFYGAGLLALGACLGIVIGSLSETPRLLLERLRGPVETVDVAVPEPQAAKPATEAGPLERFGDLQEGRAPKAPRAVPKAAKPPAEGRAAPARAGRGARAGTARCRGSDRRLRSPSLAPAPVAKPEAAQPHGAVVQVASYVERKPADDLVRKLECERLRRLREPARVDERPLPRAHPSRRRARARASSPRGSRGFGFDTWATLGVSREARWLVTGARGQLGRAVLALAGAHGIRAHGASHDELDIADPDAVKSALERARARRGVELRGVHRGRSLRERARRGGARQRARPRGARRRVCRRRTARAPLDGLRLRRPRLHADPGGRADRAGRPPTAAPSSRASAPCAGAGRRAPDRAHAVGVRTGTELRAHDPARGAGRAGRCASSRISSAGRRGRARSHARSSARSRSERAGRLHLACEGTSSWFDFARAIVDEGANRGLHQRVEVHAIPTREMPRPASRPAYGVLGLERARGLGLVAAALARGTRRISGCGAGGTRCVER